MADKIVYPKKYTVNGVEKTTWIKVGVLIENAKGRSIKLDLLPTNSFDGWLRVYPDDEPKQDMEERGDDSAKHETRLDDDEPLQLQDIPF